MDKKLTIQKVSAAMRKAGLRAAKWNASGQIRGWGDWTSGVRVSGHGDHIRVHYQRGRWSKPTPEGEQAKADEIAAALDAAGITYKRTEYGYGFVCELTP